MGGAGKILRSQGNELQVPAFAVVCTRVKQAAAVTAVGVTVTVTEPSDTP
jgi:hypothetical protein